MRRPFPAAQATRARPSGRRTFSARRADAGEPAPGRFARRLARLPTVSDGARCFAIR
ncbi:hypothetical protein C7S16_1949 [Burkholderia thailandensis]|uniref:Uncharacterized protein n=1 Tax=Burkholderia thailandensis TaxID=57975 RepID=A0AAW9CXG7_BURTH|nr:hypothetical protein [Burkholderia thailandensis]MDW9255610.1 hypothetical protein [Burkholderia thailandensis]